MASVGIRELKDNLSHYVRRVEAGERLQITAHGRPVAELGPISASRPRLSRWDEMVAAGTIRLPHKNRIHVANWPKIRLPKGSAAALINEDRGD